MKYYSESITNLIEELASLPNIGPKSAQRLALHILNLPEARVKHLADSILTAKQKICFCKECFNLSDRELCQVCADEKRDHQTIMVVEEPSDLAAYEKTGQYKGVYHVLHGAVNPMVGVQPENLKLKELLQRLQREDILWARQVIFMNRNNPPTEHILGEYNGSVVENRNFLLPKFFRRKTFNLNKGPEIYFNAILFSYVVIGRFL